MAINNPIQSNYKIESIRSERNPKENIECFEKLNNTSIIYDIENDIENGCYKYNYLYEIYKESKSITDLTKLKEAKKQICDNIRLFKILINRNNGIVSKLASLFHDRILSIFAPVNADIRNYLKNKEMLSIQNDILKKHAEITGQWRPEKINKKSIVERMCSQEIQETFENALQVYLNAKNSKDDIDEKSEKIMHKIKSMVSFNLNFEKNESIEFVDKIELIVKGRSCYIVFKDLMIGEGSSKKVYVGLDLTKNRAIAAGYIEDKDSIKDALEGEESTYCRIAGKDLEKKSEINCKNRIAKYIDFLEFEYKAVFISELYNYDLKNYLKISKKEKNTVSLCKELIDVNFELLCKGVIFKDLKDRNFLVDSEEHIKLTDLDLDAYTPKYLPPEIWEKGWQKSEYGEAALVWALGLILFQTYFKTRHSLIDIIAKKKGYGKIEFKTEQDWLNFSEFMSELEDSDLETEINSLSSQNPDPFAEIILLMLKEKTSQRLSLKEVQERWATAMEIVQQGVNIPQNDDLCFRPILDEESLGDEIVDAQQSPHMLDLATASEGIDEKLLKLKKFDEGYNNGWVDKEACQILRETRDYAYRRRLGKCAGNYQKDEISKKDYEELRETLLNQLEEEVLDAQRGLYKRDLATAGARMIDEINEKRLKLEILDKGYENDWADEEAYKVLRETFDAAYILRLNKCDDDYKKCEMRNKEDYDKLRTRLVNQGEQELAQLNDRYDRKEMSEDEYKNLRTTLLNQHEQKLTQLHENYEKGVISNEKDYQELHTTLLNQRDQQLKQLDENHEKGVISNENYQELCARFVNEREQKLTQLEKDYKKGKINKEDHEKLRETLCDQHHQQLKQLNKDYKKNKVREEDYRIARAMLGGGDQRKLEKLKQDYAARLIDEREYRRGRMMWSEELEDKLNALKENYKSNLLDQEAQIHVFFSQLRRAKQDPLVSELSREPQLVQVTEPSARSRNDSKNNCQIVIED